MNVQHRPQYHCLPPQNWMNDPNGLIQWQGRYHLFYQHNPTGPLWGNIHWGHAISEDLVHWQHLPLALTPSPDGPDKDGCWSGCAVDHDGVPTLLYTGVWPEVQCLATSIDDDLRTWQRHPQNPVIAAPPPDLDVTGFRDPYVWREGETWYMVLASGIKDVGGAILLYQSPDLVDWTYVGPLFVGKVAETGTTWECPVFYQAGDKWVLLFGVIPDGTTRYFVGSFADGVFTPEKRGLLDLGLTFYAPQAFLDDQGRRVLFGWLLEGRTDDAIRADGWAGAQSLPRVLTLGADGDLCVAPAPEVEKLRGRHHTEVVPGDCLEIRATFAVSATEPVGLRVRCSPDGEEETCITYDPQTRALLINRDQSSLSTDVKREPHGGPIALAPGEALELRVWVDRSVIEVFANERMALTSRVYPTRADSLGVGIIGQAHLQSLDVWEINP
ncbi:MAG: glycoside hydrolase family 32 protein [Chloroflexi bacterium]|nr:glycoside hydrolase family 32 protein [Chloroflexota bacterium]